MRNVNVLTANVLIASVESKKKVEIVNVHQNVKSQKVVMDANVPIASARREADVVRIANVIIKMYFPFKI